MKCLFKGTKQDLLDMGFRYDGFDYIIEDWECLDKDEEENAEVYLSLLISQDNVISFCTSNMDYRDFPNIEGYLYSDDLFYQSLVNRRFPLDIVCKLFLSGLVDLIEEED